MWTPWMRRTTPPAAEPPPPGVGVADEPRQARLRRVLEAELDFVARTLRAYGVSDADVDDGVQEVCVVFANKLEVVESGAERAFLFRTAHRIAFRLRRTRSRRREAPALAAEDAALDLELAALDPEQLIEERRALELVAQILDTLEPDLRDVLMLHELELLSMADIARTLDIPAGTVASRLRRARQQFQARMNRHPLRKAGAA